MVGIRDDGRPAQACDVARDPIDPLHGMHVAIKDLTDTGGLVTTYGSVGFATGHRYRQTPWPYP